MTTKKRRGTGEPQELDGGMGVVHAHQPSLERCFSARRLLWDVAELEPLRADGHTIGDRVEDRHRTPPGTLDHGLGESVPVQSRRVKCNAIPVHSR